MINPLSPLKNVFLVLGAKLFGRLAGASSEQLVVVPKSAVVLAEERRVRTIKRHRSEVIFRVFGLLSVLAAFSFLVWLLGTVISNALPATYAHSLRIDIDLTSESLTPESLPRSDFRRAVNDSLSELFPDVKGRRDTRQLRRLISSGSAVVVRDSLISDPELLGGVVGMMVPLSDNSDLYLKGLLSVEQGRISAEEIEWLEHLRSEGRITRHWNRIFAFGAASREPEMAGIWGAVVGSFFTLMVTLLLSFPVGVAAAIYLEEFAPKNRITDIIEVNINNLAAVPSIVFGLLGLGIFVLGVQVGPVFIGGGAPRSAAVTGGMVLALMTLPTIIIAGRASLKSIPPSIREAALSVGASHVQAVFHHVVPLAMPGILTGTIIGTARALGESAPLLMIGMVAFIADIPGSFSDPATVLPVQIYMWSDFPEAGFRHKTAAATVVLLIFLIFMNGLAVILRNVFEKRF